MAKRIDYGESAEQLPAAGYERQEILKEREDVLQEAGETLADKQELQAINPRAFEVENELAYYFDELEVVGKQADYCYAWVLSAQNGRHVQQKLYLGWEVVQGNSPEAAGLKGTDTTRRLGDVILMRIHKDRKRLVDMREDYKRRQQEEGVVGNLRDIGDRYARYGARITIANGAEASQVGRLAAQQAASQIADRQTDQWLREGRMPGAVMPQ